jgi:hypothetical protein
MLHEKLRKREANCMASEKYNQTYQTRLYDTVNEIQHPQKGFEDKFQPRIYCVAQGN